MTDVATAAHTLTSAVACCAAPGSTGLLHVLELLAPGATGAAIALFGVWLANRYSRESLRTQLAEAAKEATRAREFNVRRDVYLDAAEAIATGHGAVASLLDVSVPNTEIRKTITETMGKLAKVNVIGQVSTLRAVADYTCALADAQCSLWPARFQLQHFDGSAQGLQAVIDTLSRDQDRWIEMSKQHNVQAAAGQQAPPQLMEMYRTQFDFVQSQRAKLEAQKATIGGLRRELGMRYFEVSIEQMRAMQMLLPRALAAARAEMELSVDLAEIEDIFAQVAKRGEAAARQVVAEVVRLMREAEAAMLAAHPPQAPPPPPASPA
jgi:hypothetical protein